MCRKFLCSNELLLKVWLLVNITSTTHFHEVFFSTWLYSCGITPATLHTSTPHLQPSGTFCELNVESSASFSRFPRSWAERGIVSWSGLTTQALFWCHPSPAQARPASTNVPRHPHLIQESASRLFGLLPSVTPRKSLLPPNTVLSPCSLSNGPTSRRRT